MATAQLQYRVDGGALTEESTTVSGGAIISLTAGSFAGWQTAARWEIVAYPPDWPCPTGWSTDASSGHYYYLANSGSSGVTPPDIEIPLEADYWGKWLFRLTVNGTIVSDKIGVRTRSPALELDDLAVGEGAQFGDKRKWVGDQQTNARKLDEAALVSGGFVSAISATRPIKASAATGPVALTWEPNADVPMFGYKLTSCGGITYAGGAIVVTAGGGSLSMSGSTTASLSAGGGQLSLDAATTVAIGETDAILVKIGRTGQTVRLPAFAGGGTQGLVVDNSGNVGVGAAGASATAAYWEDTATALNTNGIPTRALTAQLTVKNASGSAIVPLRFDRLGATGSVLYVLDLGRTLTSGVGSVGTGQGVAFYLPDGISAADTLGATWRAEQTAAGGGAGQMSVKYVWAVKSGGVLADQMTLSAAGALRLHAYATAGIIANDISGNLSTIQPAVLTNGAVGTMPGSVNIQGLAATLPFYHSAGLPASFTRGDASDDSMLSALRVGRISTGGAGAIGLGASLTFGGQDDQGNEPDIGEIGAEMTDVGELTYASQLVFKVATAGALTQIGTWSTDGLSVTGDLTVSGDLVVSGTTTTVESTTVSLADRLVVFNSSTGIVPAPVAIAGFAIDRGSADGVTKRDAPGLLWDETNTRFALAYNTALDQSTIGTYVTLRAGGLLAPSLDVATAGALSLGTTTATSIAIGNGTITTTVTGSLVQRRDNILTTTTIGIGAVNAQAATNVAQVQKGPVVYSSGQAWDSDDSVTREVRAGWYVEPRAGSTVGYYARLAIDAGAGAWSNTAVYYTNSDPAIFGSALVSDTYVSASGSGYVQYSFSTAAGSTSYVGGVNYNDSDSGMRFYATGSAQSLYLRTNSVNRVKIDPSGNQTHSLPATSTTRHQWGTAGTRYVDRASAVFTSDTSLGYETALTYALPDNCVAEVVAYGTAIDLTTGDAAGYVKRRTVKRWSGGSATAVGSERDLGADNEDDVNWQMRVNVSGNNVIVEVEGDTSNSVKWGIDVEVHITTTGA